MQRIERIVADTDPLLALGIINRLDLLVNLYARVCVSTEGKRELERGAVKYQDASLCKQLDINLLLVDDEDAVKVAERGNSIERS